MAFNLTPTIRKYLSDKHGIPVSLDDDSAQSSVATAIVDGKIDAVEFQKLLSSEHKKLKAKARDVLKSLLSDDDERGTSQPRETDQLPVAVQDALLIRRHQPERFPETMEFLKETNPEAYTLTLKELDMSSGQFLKMAADELSAQDVYSGGNDSAPDAPTHVRVKGAGEQYSTRRSVLKHAKWDTEIHPIRNGSKSASPVEGLSEWEHAKIGAWLKFKAAKAGFAQMNEHDRAVLHESFEKDTWIGYQGDELVKRKNVKALIDDSTSGGENLVPEYFDTRVISFPLLHSEILPFVDVVDVPRGSTVETASIGNPTLTWNTAEASAQSLFTTDALVAAITASVFPVAVYLTIGRDLMGDSLPNIGRQLTENTGQRIAAELDKVILTGDGTSQPQGITLASGTTDVTPDNPTTGGVTLNDILNMQFGISKQYRVPSFNPRFAMTDARYKSHRAIATGVTGDDRLLHGMSVQSYSLLESPVGIENDGLGNNDGIYGAFSKYRLWRRAGFETGFEAGGDTLVRSNSILFHGRGRFAGKVIDANAFAVIDGWPATA